MSFAPGRLVIIAVIFVIYGIPLVLMIAWRLLDEERYLVTNLPGYSQYQSRVRWRLVPGVF